MRSGSLVHKTKTPLPFRGSGVQENCRSELRPNCHAAQQQRTEQQQVMVHYLIHGVISKRFPFIGQLFFNGEIQRSTKGRREEVLL